MIHVLCVRKPGWQAVSGFWNRISVTSQRSVQKSGLGSVLVKCIIASKKAGHLRPNIGIIVIHIKISAKVNHFHGNTVLGVINCGYRCQLVIDGKILYNGEIEVIGFIQRAGNNLSGGRVRFQAGICVISIIPGNNRWIVKTVSPPVQVDTDCAVG